MHERWKMKNVSITVNGEKIVNKIRNLLTYYLLIYLLTYLLIHLLHGAESFLRS